MLVYNIGTSAIYANQAALQTISNNIANANTDGYHRQRVNLSQSRPILQNHLQFGTGVTVSQIQRMVDSAADSALTLNQSQAAEGQARLEVLQVIESALTPGNGSLSSAVSEFFNSVEELATNPSDGTFRRVVVSAAEAVAGQITALNSKLDQLKQQQASAIYDVVNQINSLTGQIADLNKDIQLAQAGGIEPATLLDQRDQLVQQLGQLVDINPGSLTTPGSALVAAGGWLVVSDNPQQLSIVRTDEGGLEIQVAGRGPVEPASGKLAGKLAAYHEIIPAVSDSIREWTSAFVSAVNSIQATGLSLEGPVSFINGTNSVSDPTAPLNQTDALFPVGAGDLFISVTDNSSGQRETFRISIDPATDSLGDVVSQIDALTNIRASISSTGQVRIIAEEGFSFDFAGRLDSQVDTSSFSGTATPKVTGLYDGPVNANWTVTAESSGQVGVTNGLTLKVTDNQTGDVVAVLEVGSGYPANQPLEIADGLFVQLDSGTLTAGDSFPITGVSNPDTAGILTALGIGGLFQTSDLRSISVDSAYSKNPGLLAAGRTGNAADAGQLERIAQLRTAQILSQGTETIEARLASIISNSGVDVNSQKSQLDQLQSQYNQLRDQQDAISGVDPNEELLQMLQFQRAFQANARFISTVNDALDDLLGLVR